MRTRRKNYEYLIGKRFSKLAVKCESEVREQHTIMRKMQLETDVIKKEA